MSVRKLRYEEMRVGELAAARDEAPLVYVPIGSLEYHGWHLPVGFDALHAHALCLAAAEQTGGVVLPPTFWGTEGHVAFPGSLLVSPDTLAALVRDILTRLTEREYRLIVLCTGHYPEVQGRLLERVAAEHEAHDPGVRVMVLDPFTVHPTDPHAEHAGIVETSVMLHLRPELVDMTLLDQPGALEAITPDAADATAEYGRQRFETIVGEMVRTVKEALSHA
jgi:creatinine amidohydrolase